MRFDTLAVHAGGPSFTINGAHPTAPPLVPASSCWYDSADELDRVLGDQQPGYSYARYASPTVTAFEEAVAALEDAPAAVAFASGMAAIHAAVRHFAPNSDSVVFATKWRLPQAWRQSTQRCATLRRTRIRSCFPRTTVT